MIEILFFAHLQEEMGTPKLNWSELPISVGDLKEKLTKKYSLRLNHVMTAVNEEYADHNRILASGDVVAFIPPVSGG